MCLSETKTALGKSTFQRNNNFRIKKKIDQYSNLVGSASKVASASYVKPGVTMVCTYGNWTSMIYEKGQDDEGMGRWSYNIKVAGKKILSLLLYADIGVVRGKNCHL